MVFAIHVVHQARSYNPIKIRNHVYDVYVFGYLWTPNMARSCNLNENQPTQIYQNPNRLPLRMKPSNLRSLRSTLKALIYQLLHDNHSVQVRMNRPQRVPHCFGEPAAVGMVDKMPRRIAQLMIQSVAHVSRVRGMCGNA